jgi:hypothetical protein
VSYGAAFFEEGGALRELVGRVELYVIGAVLVFAGEQDVLGAFGSGRGAEEAVPGGGGGGEDAGAVGRVWEGGCVVREVRVPFLVWTLSKLALQEPVARDAGGQEQAERAAEPLLLGCAPGGGEVDGDPEALPDVGPGGDVCEEGDREDEAEGTC